MAELSPMMRQFVDMKEKNKDKILFFRVGDFYEMFFDDAVLASKELELTLTGKECGLEERAPMCGVPHHSAEAYIARLIEKGYKVAICEQVEDPAETKGLMHREIVRVVTPGTVIENSMLEDDRNNFIASIYISKAEAGVCFADISTGATYTTRIKSEEIVQNIISELHRYSPREILFNSAILDYKEITKYIKNQLNCSVELMDDADYEPAAVKALLQKQFASSPKAISALEVSSPEYFAMGALVAYLESTQKHGIERLQTVSSYKGEEYMKLPPITRINLELTETLRGREKKGSLLWVLDKTGTAMGKRLLRLWLEQPLMNVDAINMRLAGVEELYKENITRLELESTLSAVFDIERLMTRAIYGTAIPKEITALASACKLIPTLITLLSPFESDELKNLRAGLDPLLDVCVLIDNTLKEDVPALMKDGGFIREGFAPEVDELRDIVHGGKGVLAKIETRLREETNIRTLRIGYNRVFGYYIEVSKSFVNQVPEHFIRKQTLTGGERYITEELKQLENKILGANECLAVLERQLFTELLAQIAAELLRIQTTAGNIARLDVLVSFAQVAVENDYCCPVVNSGDTVNILQGRHPVVEKMQMGSLFVPNDTFLDCEENRMQIITGPNMAGKSTYMRQTALIVLMAQIGSFVPASECQVGVCDAVYTRVGASDDLSQGQSTFMVEMSEMAYILNDATSKSFVILDEIGRGTSTFDGMSIAQAIVEFMAAKDKNLACKTMFATHYHELTGLEKSIDGVKNYNTAVKKRGDNITFLRRIVRGAADDSYGIQVAMLAGLPEDVTGRAKQVLKVLEANSGKTSTVSQLDFETYEKLHTVDAPAEVIEKLKQIDPETLTPLEALKFIYELKSSV